MSNNFILELVGKLHGYHTRIKECHYGAPSYNIHKLTDDFIEELDTFEDDLVENASALYGFIYPGDLNPKLPDAKDFISVLEDLRGELVGIKRELGENMLATGIINITDDFFSTVNKYIYLTKIIEQQK